MGLSNYPPGVTGNETYFDDPSPEPCFACGKKMRHNIHMVDTRDDQRVFVGGDCYRHVIKAGEVGYQPPLGGPRLWLLTTDKNLKKEHSCKK